MKAPITLRGELFGLLKLRGWDPKTIACYYAACNKAYESAHVLGALLQLSDGRSPPPLAHAVQLARHGAPQDQYISQAAKFIQDTELWLQTSASTTPSSKAQ